MALADTVAVVVMVTLGAILSLDSGPVRTAQYTYARWRRRRRTPHRPTR